MWSRPILENTCDNCRAALRENNHRYSIFLLISHACKYGREKNVCLTEEKTKNIFFKMLSNLGDSE